MTRATYQALKRHILRDREKRKQEQVSFYHHHHHFFNRQSGQDTDGDNKLGPGSTIFLELSSSLTSRGNK